MVDVPPSIPLPTCMIEAANLYHIPLRGFLALWLTEGGKPGMKNKNKNGTYDYGAFQVNTIWADKLLADFGVKAEQLQNDFCASAYASAYILKYNIILERGDFWQGVGRYHSNTPARKAWYIGQVYQNSLRF